MATYRRAQVAALLNHYGYRRGVQRTIAAHLHVSTATVSRDVRAILTWPDPCPNIGRDTWRAPPDDPAPQCGPRSSEANC